MTIGSNTLRTNANQAGDKYRDFPALPQISPRVSMQPERRGKVAGLYHQALTLSTTLPTELATTPRGGYAAFCIIRGGFCDLYIGPFVCRGLAAHPSSFRISLLIEFATCGYLAWIASARWPFNAIWGIRLADLVAALVFAPSDYPWWMGRH